MSDSRVVQIIVTTATEDLENAGTDDPVKLHILSKEGIIIETIRLDHPNNNDFEPGSEGCYSMLLHDRIAWERLQGFRLQIYGHDAWLPRSIMIELKLLSSGQTRIAAYYDLWMGFWLSTDTSDANNTAHPAYDLPIFDFNIQGLTEASPAPTPSFKPGDIVDPKTGLVIANTIRDLSSKS